MSAYERSPWWRLVEWRRAVPYSVACAGAIATAVTAWALPPGGPWREWAAYFAVSFPAVLIGVVVIDVAVHPARRGRRRRRRNRRSIHAE